MDQGFYRDLIQMVDEAEARLDKFEGYEDDRGPFEEMRAIGAACLEGDTINPSIRADLGARRIHAFQTAVIKLFTINILTKGRNNNESPRQHLAVIKAIAKAMKSEVEERSALDSAQSRNHSAGDYVHQSRIAELRKLQTPQLDPKRLIRLLTELNVAHAAECHMATAMIVRAIVDHVPPVFGVQTFAQVASNYSGRKSFKKSMNNLQNSLRNIADSHLHSPMRRTETLPTPNQVNFGADLDVLLEEVVRVLSGSP